jgi:hypothetical protein
LAVPEAVRIAGCLYLNADLPARGPVEPVVLGPALRHTDRIVSRFSEIRTDLFHDTIREMRDASAFNHLRGLQRDRPSA